MSDDSHSRQREVVIEDTFRQPYVTINYKLRSLNPKKELVVAVDTDHTLFQLVKYRLNVYSLVN